MAAPVSSQSNQYLFRPIQVEEETSIGTTAETAAAAPSTASAASAQETLLQRLQSASEVKFFAIAVRSAPTTPFCAEERVNRLAPLFATSISMESLKMLDVKEIMNATLRLLFLTLVENAPKTVPDDVKIDLITAIQFCKDPSSIANFRSQFIATAMVMGYTSEWINDKTQYIDMIHDLFEHPECHNKFLPKDKHSIAELTDYLSNEMRKLSTIVLPVCQHLAQNQIQEVTEIYSAFAFRSPKSSAKAKEFSAQVSLKKKDDMTAKCKKIQSITSTVAFNEIKLFLTNPKTLSELKGKLKVIERNLSGILQEFEKATLSISQEYMLTEDLMASMTQTAFSKESEAFLEMYHGGLKGGIESFFEVLLHYLAKHDFWGSFDDNSLDLVKMRSQYIVDLFLIQLQILENRLLVNHELCQDMKSATKKIAEFESDKKALIERLKKICSSNIEACAQSLCDTLSLYLNQFANAVLEAEGKCFHVDPLLTGHLPVNEFIFGNHLRRLFLTIKSILSETSQYIAGDISESPNKTCTFICTTLKNISRSKIDALYSQGLQATLDTFRSHMLQMVGKREDSLLQKRRLGARLAKNIETLDGAFYAFQEVRKAIDIVLQITQLSKEKDEKESSQPLITARPATASQQSSPGSTRASTPQPPGNASNNSAATSSAATASQQK